MIEWIQHLVDRLARLLTETDTTLSEFWGSTLLIASGGWLLIPFDNDTFTIGPYRLIREMATEPQWGLAIAALGGLQMLVNLKRNRNGRRAAAFAASSAFGFLAILVFLSFPATLLVPSFATAAFCEGLVFWRLRFRDAEPRRAVA